MGERAVVDEQELPEERNFKAVLVGAIVGAALFVGTFGVLTVVKAVKSPHDVTSNWFVAWGTWAGGLGTAAAFLIAAASIAVASAHTRFDRREAARLREDDEMAQARLLTVYKVEGELSLSSLATYRIENRSGAMFFDVTVPYVDSPSGQGEPSERRTADLVAKDNRIHEFIPTGEVLTPYRDHTEDELWFTLVTVHTTEASRSQFAVEYTDANGRRWRQQLGGKIERITTTEAVHVRAPDRFQPPQQIRRMTSVESWRAGFTEGLEPLQSDAEFLEVLGAYTARNWKRIERVGEVEVRMNDIDIPPEGSIAVVTFQRAAPPFWGAHFRGALAESGLRYGGGHSDGSRQTDKFRLDPEVDTDVRRIAQLVDAGLEYANDAFEQNELAAAQRALGTR